MIDKVVKLTVRDLVCGFVEQILRAQVCHRGLTQYIRHHSFVVVVVVGREYCAGLHVSRLLDRMLRVVMTHHLLNDLLVDRLPGYI